MGPKRGGAMLNYLKALRYSLYTIFHPFKGFWDIKHKKKGSLAASLTFLSVYVLTAVFRAQFTGYIFNENYPDTANVFKIILQSVMLFFLWCLSNWCLTTLMDGEGSFRDITTAVGYALVPVIIGNLLITWMSNGMILEEQMFITYIDGITLLWTGMLLLFGTLVVHQYSLLKTVVTSLLTVVVMMIVVFIGLLCISLMQQLADFFESIYKEIAFRI